MQDTIKIYVILGLIGVVWSIILITVFYFLLKSAIKHGIAEGLALYEEEKEEEQEELEEENRPPVIRKANPPKRHL